MRPEQNSGVPPGIGGEREFWEEKPLTELMAHIVQTHHAYCRGETQRIRGLFQEVIREQGAAHPELKPMRDLFFHVTQDLANHLVKEEQTLFPFIARFEAAILAKEPVSWPPFGTVGNPIRIMIVEHGKTTLELEQLQKLSQGHTLPAEATGQLATLYEALSDFARDMERHVSREEEILFPRAVRMEAEACSTPSPAAG